MQTEAVTHLYAAADTCSTAHSPMITYDWILQGKCHNWLLCSSESVFYKHAPCSAGHPVLSWSII